MDASARLSEEEYLHAAYKPECEYEDGILIARYVGEQDHTLNSDDRLVR
jgi:hypothetical protein